MGSIRPDPNLLKKYPNAITQTDIDQRNRCLGVLPGLAIGDALGAPHEFLTEEDLRESHPNGPRELTGGGDFGWKPGEPTDDTQLALLVAESVAAATRVDLNDLSNRLVGWLNSKPRDLGPLLRAALENLRAGDPPDQTGALAWEDSGRQDAGNTSLPITVPLALLHLKSGEGPAEDAARISRITHYDPRSVGGCVALTTAIAGLVRGDSDALERAAQASMSYSDDVRAVIERALARPPSGLVVDGPDRSHVLVTIELAFSAVAHAEDFEEGLVQVIAKGGDADTNGAVAGALLGAKFGRNKIPERWLKGTQAVPRLLDLSEKIYKSIGGK